MNKVPRRVHDLTGLTFGRLTAISRYVQPGLSVWKCQCSCGGFKDVPASQLLRHITQSCGCLRFGTLNMHSYTRDDTARDRGNVLMHVQRNPGNVCKEIADALGKPKTSVYEHLSALEGEGKIMKRSTLRGGVKRVLGYYIDERERVSRFDYPNQATIAAIDKAKDIPAMDPLLSALFGRATSTIGE